VDAGFGSSDDGLGLGLLQATTRSGKSQTIGRITEIDQQGVGHDRSDPFSEFS
jgi:hypothetical protein